MTIDEEIQAVIDDPNTTDWLREALEKSLVRTDPMKMLDDVEQLTELIAQYTHDKAAEAMAWLALQRAATRG